MAEVRSGWPAPPTPPTARPWMSKKLPNAKTASIKDRSESPYSPPTSSILKRRRCRFLRRRGGAENDRTARPSAYNLPTMRRRLSLLILLLLSLTRPSLAETPDTAKADYDLLQRWRFRSEPIAVPAGGIRWSDEGGSWVLESGRIWLEEPTSSGVVTGLVFEGKGRFQMAVPDPIELAQLRRFTQKPELASIDEPFSSLVLRTAG